jgi:RHS repeat-associated protein
MKKIPAGGGAPSLYYIFGDHLTGTNTVFKASNNTFERQRYLPHGEPRGSSGVTTTRYGFTGHRRDPTGLMYYGARYYDPLIGRFAQPDPLNAAAADPGGFDRYASVGNNPVRKIDPTGKFTLDLTAAVQAYYASMVAGWFSSGDPEPVPAPGPIVVPELVTASHDSVDFDGIQGAGSVTINLFIPDDKVCFIICVLGDDRGFDASAGLNESRATVTLDFETGEAEGAFNYSCRTGGILGPADCNSAFPVDVKYNDTIEDLGTRQVCMFATPEGCAVVETISLTTNVETSGAGNNNIFINRVGPRDFIIGIEGEVSVGLPGSPSINGTIALTISEDGLVSAEKSGNGFPAYEIYQSLNGTNRIVGQFAAGQHWDLMDGPAGSVFRACDFIGLCG